VSDVYDPPLTCAYVSFKLGRGGAKRTRAMSQSVAELIPSTVVLVMTNTNIGTSTRTSTSTRTPVVYASPDHTPHRLPSTRTAIALKEASLKHAIISKTVDCACPTQVLVWGHMTQSTETAPWLTAWKAATTRQLYSACSSVVTFAFQLISFKSVASSTFNSCKVTPHTLA
jgi:hypothetical protein